MNPTHIFIPRAITAFLTAELGEKPSKLLGLKCVHEEDLAPEDASKDYVQDRITVYEIPTDTYKVVP